MTNAPFVMLGRLGNMNRSQCDVNWKKQMVSVCGKCLVDLCRGLLVCVSYHATYHVVSGRSCALLPTHRSLNLKKKKKNLRHTVLWDKINFLRRIFNSIRFMKKIIVYAKIISFSLYLWIKLTRYMKINLRDHIIRKLLNKKKHSCHLIETESWFSTSPFTMTVYLRWLERTSSHFL